MNVESVDLITKFFNVFQSLSMDDQKKALLVVEGMSICKQSIPAPDPAAIFSAAGNGATSGDVGTAQVPTKNNSVKESKYDSNI